MLVKTRHLKEFLVDIFKNEIQVLETVSRGEKVELDTAVFGPKGSGIN